MTVVGAVLKFPGVYSTNIDRIFSFLAVKGDICGYRIPRAAAQMSSGFPRLPCVDIMKEDR